MRGNLIRIFLLITLVTAFSCDKTKVENSTIPLPVHVKDPKPDSPVALGCIRGYIGDYYRTFAQHIDQVQPVDSFSNVYFYGNCGSEFSQINLIRSDTSYVLAIYIMGYPLDSIPTSLPVKAEYGKYFELQFYSFGSWNSTSQGHYVLDNFYGTSLLVTDVTDDIVTGTFSGLLQSSTGSILPVTEGEFKIKLFRKHVSCGSAASGKLTSRF